MNLGKVRTVHRRLGISIAFFLFVQAMTGMLMSVGRLAALDMSPPYNILYFIHADWNPSGSIYRVILGLATSSQGVLGIMLFLGRLRFKKKKETSPESPGRSDAFKKEAPVGTLSFAGDIRSLFREGDIRAMEPMGIDLSSYEDVKKRAEDIYARLTAKEMPCDGPWSEDKIKRLKQWMDEGMQP